MTGVTDEARHAAPADHRLDFVGAECEMYQTLVYVGHIFRYPAGSHVVFYRETDDTIDVIRVLHQRMDIERHP